jgi:hypothetical protein
LAENNLLPTNTYELDIAVANVTGTTTFSSALKYNIGEAPSGLSYNENNSNISLGSDFATVTPDIGGGNPISFELLNAGTVATFVTVHNNTGVISIDGSMMCPQLSRQFSCISYL